MRNLSAEQNAAIKEDLLERVLEYCFENQEQVGRLRRICAVQSILHLEDVKMHFPFRESRPKWSRRRRRPEPSE